MTVTEVAPETVILATGPVVTFKLTGALVMPCADAVICVVPGAAPAARPFALMEAKLAALLAHVNVMPLMLFPLLSFAVAVNWTVPLSATEVVPVTVIEASVALPGVCVVPAEEPPPQPAAAR